MKIQENKRPSDPCPWIPLPPPCPPAGCVCVCVLETRGEITPTTIFVWFSNKKSSGSQKAGRKKKQLLGGECPSLDHPAPLLKQGSPLPQASTTFPPLRVGQQWYPRCCKSSTPGSVEPQATSTNICPLSLGLRPNVLASWLASRQEQAVSTLLAGVYRWHYHIRKQRGTESPWSHQVLTLKSLALFPEPRLVGCWFAHEWTTI